MKKKLKMTRNKNFENINWYYLNKRGIIISDNCKALFEGKAGVYVYQLILDENMIYIGSSFDLLVRFRQHKHCVRKGSNVCPKFYNSVRKYGWDNFRLGILEYIDKSQKVIKNEIKTTILVREQFYLNSLNPNLNINKIAGSMLGYKHTQELRKLMSLQRKGKSINWSRKDPLYTITEETRNNLSLRVRGVTVKVFDNENNIVNVFPTIKSAANFFDVDYNTVSKCIKSGNLINNYRFEAELKNNRVWIFDKQRNLINVFPNASKAAKYSDTSHTTVCRYIKSGKLWKDKYYFRKSKKKY